MTSHAIVKSVDNDTLTVKSNAMQPLEARNTPSTGTTATLGSRIEIQFDFNQECGRVLRDIEMLYTMTNPAGAATEVIYTRNGILDFIEEIRLTLNGQNFYLHQFGHALDAYWSRYTDEFDDILEFYDSRSGTVASLANNNVSNPEYDLTDAITVGTGAHRHYQLTGGTTSNYVMRLPFKFITSLFEGVATDNLKQVHISILLKSGSGGNDDLKYCGKATTTTLPARQLIRFDNIEFKYLVDRHKNAVKSSKSFLTKHLNFYEEKSYTTGITAGGSITINLSTVFSPLKNIRRLYYYFKPSAYANALGTGEDNPVIAYSLYEDKYVNKIQLLQSGVIIKEWKSRGEIQDMMKQNKERRSLYTRQHDQGYLTPTSTFVDLSRALIQYPAHGQLHKTKTINGVENNTSKWGEYQIKFYYHSSLPAQLDTFVIKAEATRLIHLGNQRQNNSVKEEK
jgi:hypothetical protein